MKEQKENMGILSLIKKGGLGKTLIIWFLGIALLPLFLVSIISYQSAYKSLRSDAEHQLAAVAREKRDHVKTFFSERISDVAVLSSRNSTVQTLQSLIHAMESTGLKPDEFMQSSAWQSIVKQYDKEYVEFQESYGYYNLFLIDNKGNIIYSVKHEDDDLGLSVFAGEYKDTKLSQACRKALETNEPVFSDFDEYEGSDNKTSAFIVNGVCDETGRKIGVLALQINIRQIDSILQGQSGLGQRGEIDLVSTSDWKVKSCSAGKQIEEEESNWYKKNNTELTAFQEGKVVVFSRREGSQELCTHYGLDVVGVKMAIVAWMDEAEALYAVTQQQKIAVVMTLVTIIFIVFAALIVTRRIVRPMLELSHYAHRVAIGDLNYEVVLSSKGEIGQMSADFKDLVESRRLITSICEDVAKGNLRRTVFVRSEEDGLCTALNQIIENLRNVVQQADAIAKGDYSIDITPLSDTDEIGMSLSHMTVALREATAENEKQSWLKTGLNDLYDRMRGEQDLIELVQNVISFLTDYLDTQVGAFFLNDEEKMLKMVGSYAYTRRKNLSNEYAVGEGLVGQAALEKKNILITGVPDDYVKINSGLGEAVPRNLLVVPAIYEGEVKAVIELGSFHEFTDDKIDFLNQAAASIAIAINTARSRVKLEGLLDETQRQSEELQVQQEELRQTNEELEEQTRGLRDSEAKLQVQQEELRQTNEELEEKNRYLEKQHDDIRKKNEELEYTRYLIEEKAKDLELSGKYKSEFLANMSHELRTPLNSLLILSRLLYENNESNLTEKQVEFARTIYSAGSDLLALINDILDLSKVEAGKMELAIHDVDISDLAEGIERHFRHMAEEKGLNFNVELSGGIPSYIRTDRQRVEQILKNLLSNAIKFTSKGSIVLKIGRPEPGTELLRSGLDLENSIAFSITDTGIGIAADKQKLIFEAFQQADGTTSRQYGGTGLGLSISRELAKYLGGEIQLRSQEDVGSNFTIYLPEMSQTESDKVPRRGQKDLTSKMQFQLELTEQKDLREQKTQSFVAQKLEQPTPLKSEDQGQEILASDRSVLIVEDDSRFAAILVELAKGKGFNVFSAEDGETGLQYAVKYKPSAIILDVGLPGIDGWTVMERLKDSPETRHIPVHFISAYDSGLDAMRMGAIGYLTKPVTMEVLDGAFNKIESIVSKNVKKLLVVEDDEMQQRSILELIGDGDVMTTAVGSGSEAFELLKTDSFDCVVLDLGLQDMSGFDLLEKIRSDKTISHIPVIVYTGKDLTKEEDARLREHAESIIIKGVKSPERLLDETTLFLHRVEANLSEDRQKMLKMIHNRETIFQDKKVLLVDDDMRNVFALLNVLEEKGMKVLVGRNGKEGITLLNDNPDADIVLMDIMMPEMDGYEAMRQIRKQDKFRNLPIIALTAKAMVGDRSKCIEAGASDYLSKPIDTDKLLSLLRVWLYR